MSYNVSSTSSVKLLRPRAKKYLMVDDLPDNDTIYVYNNIKADYCMTVYPGNSNRDIIVRIEETWIPRPITNIVSPKVIKESEQFRQAVNKGILELVDKTEAREVLATVEAQRELERLRKNYSSIEYENEDNSLSTVQALRDNFKEVDEELKNIVSRDDLSDDDRFALVFKRNMQEPLSELELDFLISTTEGTHPNIHNWAVQAKAVAQKQ